MRQRYKAIFDVDYIRQILSYDATTGILTWQTRSDRSQRWNTKHANKPAGWVGKGKYPYVQIRIDGELILGHILAWVLHHGVWPDCDIDHKNTCGTDNWILNLRRATKAQNLANRSKPSNNKSGYKGVTFEKQTKKWRAQIVANGVHHSVGRFDTPEEAAEAYRAAAERLHGEFART